MMGYFLIPLKLPSLNEVIGDSRANRYRAGQNKQEIEAIIGVTINQAVRKKMLTKVKEPVDILIDFYESTKRRDVDNIHGGGTKVIMDALVKKGIIPDDGQKWVKQIYHRVLQGNRDCVVVYICRAGFITLKWGDEDESKVDIKTHSTAVDNLVADAAVSTRKRTDHNVKQGGSKHGRKKAL